MTISLLTANAVLLCISNQLATEYSTNTNAHEANATVNYASKLIAELIDNDILPTDSTPTSLGKLLFGEEFVANKTNDNWQATFIHAIVSRLSAAVSPTTI